MAKLKVTRSTQLPLVRDGRQTHIYVCHNPEVAQAVDSDVEFYTAKTGEHLIYSPLEVTDGAYDFRVRELPNGKKRVNLVAPVSKEDQLIAAVAGVARKYQRLSGEKVAVSDAISLKKFTDEMAGAPTKRTPQNDEGGMSEDPQERILNTAGEMVEED